MILPHRPSPRVSRSSHLWLLVLVLLIAAALRLIRVGALPPGLHYDEAADTIIAEQIARGESAPIFVAAYTGKEVLFFYWAAGWMKLIGPSVFAMRLAAAMLGVLTVAVTYWAAREMLDPHPALSLPGRGGEGVAVLAAVFVATSFWHVLMSRLGFRSIAEPFVQALALAVLFRGVRLGQRKWFVAAGAFVGLDLYTYLAARLFPVVIAIIFAYAVVFDRGHRRERLVQFGSIVVSALIIFAPLGFYFLNHPDAFLTRITQVAPRVDQAAALLDNILRALGMFFVQGDPYVRFNQPGRPLFPILLGGLFVIGLLVAGAGVWRGRTFRRRLAYFSLIALTFVMLLPTALAVNEITPSNLRAIGMMPAVFVFPALGAWWIVRGIWARMKKPSPIRIYLSPLAFAVILAATTFDAAVAYFGQYVHEPQLYVQSDGDLADIANVLNHTDTLHDSVYIAALHYRHPTVAALADRYGDFKWLTGDRVVVLPDGPAYLIFARLALPDQAWLGRFLPDSTLVDAPLAPDGQTNYRIYHVSARPPVQPQVVVNANFGNIIQLIGFDREPGAESGQTANVTLYWKVLNKPDRGDYSTFVELRDRWGFEWDRAGSFDYPSEEWTPGEIIINQIDVPVAAGTPPDDYEVRVGWFSPSAGQRLNIVAPDGGFGGTVTRLSPISIARAAVQPDVKSLGIGTDVERQMADGLTLLGYSREAIQAHQGETFYFTLFWQSERSSIQDASVSIQLRGPATISLTDIAPVHGTYPFSRWTANEIVADRYGLRVPVDAPPGAYSVEAAVGNARPIELGDLTIEKTDRVWTEPPVDHRLEAKLDESVELVGYNIEQTSGSIRLRLIWRALKSIDVDYTVFTHVLDPTGAQIGGQDNQPMQGTYPTSWWAAGEYVVDPYDIKTRAPSQGYTLEVGMYDPETGARLGAALNLTSITR